MRKDSGHGDWLGSKEARKELEVSACDLSHIREAGELRYRKAGNAYRYDRTDIDRLESYEEVISEGGGTGLRALFLIVYPCPACTFPRCGSTLFSHTAPLFGVSPVG